MQKYIKKFKRMHKELNNKKINNPIKKWAKHLTRHFSREDIQTVTKLINRCSGSLIVREMEINHNEIQFIHTRMAIF